MNPGMDPAVQEAIQRRMGTPTPQLSQVSSGAAMQSGQMPPPMPQSEMTATSNPPAGAGIGASTGSVPSQKFEPQDKIDMIVMSLLEYLKNDQKLKKEEIQMSQVPAIGGGGMGYTPYK